MLYLLAYPAVALAATTFVGTLLYYTYPSILVKLYLRTSLYYAGLRVKYVEEKGFKFCYAERGEKFRDSPSLLLLHGFSAGKDNFTSIYGKIPHDIHIIGIDLPGHGNTSIPSTDDDISIEGFVCRIEQFVKLVGLDEQPFHIFGQSLGGQLAAMYAAKNPQLVDRVTLVCPAMGAAVESAFEKRMRELIGDKSGDSLNTVHCPLIPETMEELKGMMNLVLHKQKPPSKQILKAILDLRRPYTEFYVRMFKVLCTDRYSKLVETCAHKIQAPVQVIWGRNDQVIDVSAVEVLKKIVPNLQQIDIFDECGHSVNFETPTRLVKALLKFREDFKKDKST